MNRFTYFSFLILFSLNLFYCNTTPKVTNNDPPKEKEKELSEVLNERVSEPFDTTKIIPVLFITNRKTPNDIPSCSNSFYGVEFSEKLIQGTCDVNVPAKHEIGNLDSDANGDANKFFKINSHKPITDKDLLPIIKENKFPEVILFVHGFNVPFEEAVYRAAQIKYDLKFPGEVVLFTWPSGAKSGGILESLSLSSTYKDNQQNANKTIPLLKDFIQKLNSTGKKIHLIVHSMGHQIALPAISELSSELKSKFLQEVILNAPDYPSSSFYEISPKVKSTAKRITVYCSPADKALMASVKVNNNKRLGSCEKINGVDVINVNEIDDSILGLNHGYYSSRPILTDVYQTILGIDANRRLFIRKSTEGSEDYVLRK